MSQAESLTQKWLRQNVSPYSQKDRVFADIDASLARFSALRPKSDIYTYDDGRAQLLLCVHGLLPISFRSASYNIPVAIWIPRDYPRSPPIAYVVPTTDMLVKAGKYLDVSGRCSIEYLRHWETKSEGCNLSALLEAMQDQFSHEPPVYAKPKDSSTANLRSSQTMTPTYAARPPPPLPPAHTPPVSSQSLPLSPVHSDRPRLPPKPITSVISPGPPSTPSSSIPTQNHHMGITPIQNSSFPSRPRSELSPPQYGTPSVPPTYQLSNAASSIAVVPDNLTSWPSRSPPPFGSPSHRWSTPPLQSTSTHLPSPPPPPPPPPKPAVPNNGRSPPMSPPPPAQSYYPHPPRPITLPDPPPQPHLPPPNLLDEDSSENLVSDPFPPPANAPPRPPNPELLRLHAQIHAKITTEFSSLSQALSLDADRLRAHQKDLLVGEPAIRDEMARLEAVRAVCTSVAGRMRGTVDQVERNVAELRRKGDPEVDELVCSTSIVHNQLINLVAEDNAIEDTIYHLHRALNTGRIDLERFLRTTRVLAEEQFMKRALIEKIQTGIPMGMSMG